MEEEEEEGGGGGEHRALLGFGCLQPAAVQTEATGPVLIQRSEARCTGGGTLTPGGRRSVHTVTQFLRLLTHQFCPFKLARHNVEVRVRQQLLMLMIKLQQALHVV